MILTFFKVVVLVCPSGLALADCDATNASATIRHEERYATPFACLAEGEQTLAAGGLDRLRVKILCPRVSLAK